MKKVTLVLFFASLMAVAANAQDAPRSSSYPYWTISKDVQRMAYKNTILTPAVISTGDVVPVSKGVQQLQVNNTPRRKGMVSTNGYPAWTISKGAARFQAQRNSK